MYKLYLDKPESFECDVAVKNASLKGSVARLVVESADGVNLVFNGKIDGGKCVVPVRRLKGLLDENIRGNMFLEVIVEDTYFKPWTSDFVVEEHTSVKVKISEQKESSTKPSVQVRVPVKETPATIKKGKVEIPIKEAIEICRKAGITHKKDILKVLREYLLK